MRPFAYPARTVTNDFMRGLVATGVLAAVQQRTRKPALDKRTLRMALQGGAALAAGTAAVQAWQRHETVRALTAVALGTLGVVAAERLLSDTSSKESKHGQEEV